MKVLTLLALATITILFIATFFTTKEEQLKPERLPKVIIVTAPSSHR